MDRASVTGTCQRQSQQLQAEPHPTSKATFPIWRLPGSPLPWVSPPRWSSHHWGLPASWGSKALRMEIPRGERAGSTDASHWAHPSHGAGANWFAADPALLETSRHYWCRKEHPGEATWDQRHTSPTSSAPLPHTGGGLQDMGPVTLPTPEALPSP